MAYQIDRNDLFRKVFKLVYEKMKLSKTMIPRGEWERVDCLEFVPSNDFDRTQANWRNSYPDPEGKLIGASFQLASRGYLVPHIISRADVAYFAFKLTELGLNLYEDNEKFNREFPSTQGDFCFLIMSFSEDRNLEDVYNGIKNAVKSCGYSCIRADEIEHNGRITDKIIECILSAKFIISDLTEQRPNCYYELGFAHAMEKEVIHIAKQGEYIHFDVSDYNFIFYSNITVLTKKLKERISKTIGKKAIKRAKRSDN